MSQASVQFSLKRGGNNSGNVCYYGSGAFNIPKTDKIWWPTKLSCDIFHGKNIINLTW